MPSAADIGANFSSYTGNSNLGGGDIGVAKIDTSPIQNLAHYTFLYNKDQYEQKQKETDAKIKDLAKLTEFDPNSAIPHDLQAAKDAYAKLVAEADKYARSQPSNTSDKATQAWDFQKNIAGVQKTIASIKERAISYNKRETDIKNNTTMSADQKKMRLDELEKAADTDVNTSIASEDRFNETIPEIKGGTLRKIEVGVVGGNVDVTQKIDILTSTDLLRESQAESTGIQSVINGEYKDYFKAGKNPYVIFNNSAEAYNAALNDPKYQIKDGNGNVTIDYDAIQKSNPLLHDVNAAIDGYNTWAQGMQAQARSGVFTDKLGKSVKLLQGVTDKDWFTIDKGKPLTGDQIIMLEKFRKSPTLITTSEQLQETGNQKAIQLEGMRQAGENKRNANTQANENWRLKYGIQHKPATGVVGDGTDAELGNLIYGVNIPFGLNGNNVGVKDGQAVNEKGEPVSNVNGEFRVHKKYLDNSIVTEFNKYSGQSRVDKDGNVLSTPSPSKLEAERDYYTVRMKDGVIDGIKTSDGTFSTVDQFQHITRNAAIKGTTKYIKPDTNYGGKKTQADYNDPASWVKEGDNWRLKGGGLYDAKGKLIK